MKKDMGSILNRTTIVNNAKYLKEIWYDESKKKYGFKFVHKPKKITIIGESTHKDINLLNNNFIVNRIIKSTYSNVNSLFYRNEHSELYKEFYK